MKRTFLTLILLTFSAGALAAAPVTGKAPDTRQAKAADRLLTQDGKLTAGVPNEAELNALIMMLESETERKKLIETLKTLNSLRQKSAAKQKAQQALGAQILGFLSDRVDRVSRECAAGADRDRGRCCQTIGARS